MPLRTLPLIILLAVFSGPAFAGDETTCRLQDNAECLEALQVRAANVASTRTADSKLYAVLVNGDSSDLHNLNIERAYEVLRTLGVPDENLYILSNSNPRPSAKITTLVTARATTGNLSNVLAYVAGEIDENDCLLLYTTGHGIRAKGQSAVVLNDGLLMEKDLVKEMKRMTPAVSVVVMDQCFSGGFADAVEKSGLNAIAIASTDSRHETYCEYFAGAFWLSMIEPEADINRDGRVSLTECYDVAMSLHQMALADTPERTHCRYVTTESGPEPAVVLGEQTFTWDTEDETPRAKLVTASADAPQRPVFRRHRAGFRAGE
ncbi:MAG: C13 family peptidase [FCB group bacterium]|jgi:hypothetical protein|nr:C13 family peptidase [FCB group bacterium]